MKRYVTRSEAMTRQQAGGVLALVFVLVLVAGISRAQSNLGTPSNLVGVWNMTLQPGAHLISFPLLPNDPTVENLLGDQLPGGTSWDSATRIMTVGQSTVRGSFYNSSTQEWVGTLHTLHREKGYWLVIPEQNDPVVLTLIGAAISQDTTDMGTMNPGLNLVSNPHPYSSSLSESGLTESGISGSGYVVSADRVHTWTAGSLSTAWPNQQGGWKGSTFSMEPGKGYILIVAPGNAPFRWRWPKPSTDSPAPAPGMIYVPVEISDVTVSQPSFAAPPWDGATTPDRFKVKTVDPANPGTPNNSKPNRPGGEAR